MKNFSTQKERILQFLEYKGITKNKFYIKTGISNGILDKNSGLSMDTIEKFYSTYPEINPEWILTGKGDMLKSSSNKDITKDCPSTREKSTTGIPLIPIDAIAGFGSGDIQIHDSQINDYYEVPLFQKRGAKYLISVAGNSMYPKYASGDLLACKPLETLNFVQWGKPYVLDTEQGAIVKRLFEHPEEKDLLICKSDNIEFYPPFNIHKDSIYKIAIVVGVLRLE